MKTKLLQLCAAIACTFSVPAMAEDAVGSWTGAIDGALRINVHIFKAADGKIRAVLQSPDQGNKSLQADQASTTASELRFSIDSIRGSYQASWDEAKKAWVGTWTQGQSAPLELVRMDASALAVPAAKRPQEERIASSKAPYASTEVSFGNAAAGITLAGTMSVPPGRGPFPAVVLVHGSGPNDRNEDAFGHKVFLVLADHLARQGIAVLRYDKRGVKASTGNYEQATTFDFADDAQAAVAYLRTRADVDQRRIGIVGHSEGGAIAPIVAARDPKLGFIVLLAGPGIRGDALLLEQERLLGKAGGATAQEIDKASRVSGEQFAIINGRFDDAGTTARLAALMDRLEKEGLVAPGGGAAQLAVLNKPWFRAFIKFDPAQFLARVQQPVLALNGELDLQVPPGSNLAGIGEALKHNRRLQVEQLPGLNHLFQTATTGSTREYGTIEETMAPRALETISRWIGQQ